MNGDGLLGRTELERAFTELATGSCGEAWSPTSSSLAVRRWRWPTTRNGSREMWMPHSCRTTWCSRRHRASPRRWACRPGGSTNRPSSYISAQHDAGRREVFDHPGLRVMAASPEHVFAMKAFAARTRDEDDLRTLSEIIGLTTIEEALRLCERFFPGEALPSRSYAMVEDLFAQRDVG